MSTLHSQLLVGYERVIALMKGWLIYRLRMWTGLVLMRIVVATDNLAFGGLFGIKTRRVWRGAIANVPKRSFVIYRRHG